jgi:hypothetical protein
MYVCITGNYAVGAAVRLTAFCTSMSLAIESVTRVPKSASSFILKEPKTIVYCLDYFTKEYVESLEVSHLLRPFSYAPGHGSQNKENKPTEEHHLVMNFINVA